MKLIKKILLCALNLLFINSIIYGNNTGCMDDGFQSWSPNFGAPACNYDPLATIQTYEDTCYYPDCNGCFPSYPQECRVQNNNSECVYIGESGNYRCSIVELRCSTGNILNINENQCLEDEGYWVGELYSDGGECLYSNEEDCILNNGVWYLYSYDNKHDCVFNGGVWFRDGLDSCGVCGGESVPNTGTCDCLGIANGDAYDDACGNCVGVNSANLDLFSIEMTEETLIEKDLLQKHIPVYLSNAGFLSSLYIEMEYDLTYIENVNFDFGSDLDVSNYKIESSPSINNTSNKITIQFNLYYSPLYFDCNVYSQNVDCDEKDECYWDIENNICNRLEQQINIPCNLPEKEIFQVILDTKKVFDPQIDNDLISIKIIELNENEIKYDSSWSFGKIFIYHPSQCGTEGACNKNESLYFTELNPEDESTCEFPGDIGTEWEGACHCNGDTLLDDCGNCFGENSSDGDLNVENHVMQLDGDVNGDGDICEQNCPDDLILDCNNDCGGTAILDICNMCAEGSTGKVASSEIVSSDGDISYSGAYDCKGICYGSAYIDGCNNCIDNLNGKDDCLESEIKIIAEVSGNENSFKDTLSNKSYNFEDVISNSKRFYAAIYMNFLPDMVEGITMGINFDTSKGNMISAKLSPYNFKNIYGQLDNSYTLYSQIIDSTLFLGAIVRQNNDEYSDISGNILFFEFQPTKTVKVGDETIISFNHLQIDEHAIVTEKMNSFSKTIIFGDCNGSIDGSQVDSDWDGICNDVDDCPYEFIDSTNITLLGENGCLDIINNINILPSGFSISQNYPNPFNPITYIEYSIPQYSNIKINILDIKGNIINRLINYKHQPGNYRVMWDGTTKDGVLVPSGIYLYVMETENFKSVKKLILLK